MGQKALKRWPRWLLLLLAFAPLVYAAGPLTSESSVGWPEQAWITQESEHFIIHTPTDLKEIAEQVAAIAEEAHDELTVQLDWQPASKTHLVITDDHDFANGWASPSPYNQNRLYVSAPDDLAPLASYDMWLRLLIEHEYTHVLHLDQAAGLPLSLRSVLGRFPFLFPHALQPPWLIEGLAIHQETDQSSAVGRGQSNLYDMQMKAEVERGLKSLGQISGINRAWPTDQAYLYGTYFYQFLSERYGEEAALNWLRAYRSNLVPFMLSVTAENTFNTDFPRLWKEYQHYLQDRFAPSLAAESPSEQLTTHGLQSFAPVWHDEAVYRIYQNGHGPARLARYSEADPTPEILTTVEYPGPFDVYSSGQIVMAQLAPLRDNRFYSDLWRWSADTGWHQLTTRQRYRQARWVPGTYQLVARRQVNGLSELHLLDTQGNLTEVLWRGQPGEVLGSFSIAPDGQHLVAMLKTAQSSWHIAEFNLQQGNWHRLTESEADEAQPQYTNDGNEILYSADYDDVFNIYRLERRSGEIRRLTNVSSGAFNPVDSGDSLYFERYSPEGYQLHRLKQPELANRLVSLPTLSRETRPQPEAVSVSAARPYSPWSTLRPYHWFPLLNFTTHRSEIGFQTSGQDALGQHWYELSLTYDTLANAPSGYLSYQFSNRYQLLAQRTFSDILSDVHGVVGVRTRDRLAFNRLNIANWQRDRMALHAGAYLDREYDQWRDGRFQPGPERRRHTLGVAWDWSTVRSYRYNVYPVQGRRWLATIESHDIINDDFSGQRYVWDAREYWHLGRSRSLSLRAAIAYADRTAYAFGLGTDRGIETESLFGRERFALRGYDQDRLVSREFGLTSLEYRQPLSRVQQNWREFPVGLRDIYGQLFIDAAYMRNAYTGLAEELKSGTYVGVGAELSAEFVLGYNLIMPLHIGIAKGLDEELGTYQFWLRTALPF